MKNFNDFINQLDIDSLYSNSTESINENMEPEEMAIHSSMAFSISLLQNYHEWLMKSCD